MLSCPECGAYLNKNVDDKGTVSEWCDYCGFAKDDELIGASTDDQLYDDMLQEMEAFKAYGYALGEYHSDDDQ